jgi:hypothetical protein
VDWPPDTPFPRVRLVARWQGSGPSAQELAALRSLLPEVRDRPLLELAQEVRSSLRRSREFSRSVSLGEDYGDGERGSGGNPMFRRMRSASVGVTW